ncbi:MAG: ComEC/Rec2 family competence protein [Fermentimonas sp.]|jgi:beta-lactamase superfamily II metal-dependent hydrolase
MTKIFRKTFIILFALFLGGIHVIAGQEKQPEIGLPYPDWEEGELDIHHIYTGRGEANFFILPDGTSMLIDAGNYDRQDYLLMTPALPDTTRQAGEWIARYIERVNPHKDHVNYFFLSHFHDDHFGEVRNTMQMTTGRDPDYILSGISEVAEQIHFDKLVDSSYPRYDFPREDPNDKHLRNYRNFVEWQTKSGGLKAEPFSVGSTDQFVLHHDASSYPGFKVRNLVSNGVVWTGKGIETDSLVCDTRKNRHRDFSINTMSCGIRVSYGAFNYFTAGDLSGRVSDEKGNVFDIEEMVAMVCGEVDICKVNHHGFHDAMPEGFVRNIRAAHYIFPVWDYQHVQASVIGRVTSLKLHNGKQSRLYFTYIPTCLREKCRSRVWGKQIAEENGHVIVKVLPQGDRYKIYIVSAEDESMTVKAVYGPFFSKKREDKQP